MKIIRVLHFLNKSAILLLIYIVLSFVMMSFSEPSALKGVRWGLLQLSEWTNEVKNVFSSKNALILQNDYLVKENFELRVREQQLREIILENARLKRLMAFRESTPGKYIAAKVIAYGPEKNIGSVIVNVGAKDGVEINMPVINAKGLIGKVFNVTDGQAQVQLLTDRNAFVSARLQESREVGTVSWTGKGNQLELLYILENIPVTPGEVVVTSGMGGIYPPGIKIGVVTDVKSEPGNMFQKILIQSSVNFNALEEVFLLQNPKNGKER
jgi:rod shape-determining protein MreC